MHTNGDSCFPCRSWFSCRFVSVHVFMSACDCDCDSSAARPLSECAPLFFLSLRKGSWNALRNAFPKALRTSLRIVCYMFGKPIK